MFSRCLGSSEDQEVKGLRFQGLNGSTRVVTSLDVYSKTKYLERKQRSAASFNRPPTCERALGFFREPSRAGSRRRQGQEEGVISPNKRPIERFGRSKISLSFSSSSTTPALASMLSEKRSHKRQKIRKQLSSKAKSKSRLVTLDDDGDFEPLGSSKRAWEDEDKDDEERRLESVLFDKLYVPSSKGRAGDESDEEDEGMPDADVDLAGNEFANLMDSEVRHTHAPRASKDLGLI